MCEYIYESLSFLTVRSQVVFVEQLFGKLKIN